MTNINDNNKDVFFGMIIILTICFIIVWISNQTIIDLIACSFGFIIAYGCGNKCGRNKKSS